MKSEGKPGIVREFSIICIQVREKSGKTNYLVSISFLLTIGTVVRKVVAFLSEIASTICITYLLGSVFFTYFRKYAKWRSGK